MIAILQPRLMCDPVEQRQIITDPTVHEWSRCTVMEDLTGSQTSTNVRGQRLSNAIVADAVS